MVILRIVRLVRAALGGVGAGKLSGNGYNAHM